MKKVTVLGMQVEKDECFGVARRNDQYGGLLLNAEVRARKMLESDGFSFFSESELPPENADVVFCLDLTGELRERVRSLPRTSRKILLSMASPLHARFSHHPKDTLMDPVWERIVTWNRACEAEHLLVCDLPFSWARDPMVPRGHDAQPKGIAFVSSESDETLGLVFPKNRLCRELETSGEVCRGGAVGREEDLLNLTARYPFALVMEDTWYAGFVSELLPRCIMAGVPAVYWGDAVTAERRYPGTFIPLEELSVEAFFSAKEKLTGHYAELQKQVAVSQKKAASWQESYLDAVRRAFTE